MWVEVGMDGRSMAWTETALVLSKFWVARRSSSHCTLRLMQTPYTSVADKRREKLFSLPCTGNLSKDEETVNFANHLLTSSLHRAIRSVLSNSDFFFLIKAVLSLRMFNSQSNSSIL